MAKTKKAQSNLTAKQRAKIPASQYGLPKQRAYPMPDRAHASNAKARASQALKSGKISKAEFSKVVEKANRVLAGGEKGAKKAGLKTASQIAKKQAPAASKKVQSVAARKGVRKVQGGKTVTVRKGSAKKR